MLQYIDVFEKYAFVDGGFAFIHNCATCCWKESNRLQTTTEQNKNTQQKWLILQKVGEKMTHVNIVSI